MARYMEDALDAVKDYIESEFDTKLTTIEGERSIEIPRIGNLHVGETTVQKFPRVEVIPDRTEHEYSSSDQPLVRPWKYHHIQVWITHTHAKVETLRLTLTRYVEAMCRIVEDDDRFDNELTWVRVGTVEYTPMMERQGERNKLQGVTVELVCQTR